MIDFTVISGAKNEDALCYLLEIDNEVKILLDCGWSDEFNLEDLKHLRRVARQVDALLLSHPDLPHLGAYPYAFGYFGLHCPVYATVPVVNMGRMCMHDIYQSKVNETEFDTFALDNIDSAFERINGITITAYSAGHTIGGTIWKIKKDTEEIVYAVDYNHKKESNGVVLDALSRPSLMITDAYNSLIIHPPRKSRDTALFETIMSTLQNKGSVLLPTDSSARVLELAYLLDQHWAFHQLSYPLILLTHQSYRTIQYTKSMLEWMGDAIKRHFDTKRENPFEFRYLKLCHRYKDLAKYPGPKVVLASNVSLETGFSREFLFEISKSDINALILTDRGPPNSLARKLYHEWDRKSQTSQGVVKPAAALDLTINLMINKKVPLEGAELLEYKAEQRKKQEREAAQAALIAKSLSIIEEDETDDEESEAGDTDMEELLAKQFDLYVRDATKYGGFFKQTQSYLMYPFVEKRKRYDDYGEIIPSDMFKRVGGSIGTEGIGIEPIGDRDDMGGGDKEEFDKDNNNSSLDSNVPTKYVLYDEDVTFKCQIRFIDLEGTNDGRSLKTIVPQVQPRKLVTNIFCLIPSTKDFAQSCLALESMTKDIYTPDVGETLNVSAAINFYQVKLTDSLISSLNFSKDYDIAFITGKISFPQDYSLPILDAIPIEENTSNNNPIFVGEVKLSELKRLLQSEGITAEFKGEGVLVCNEKVAIKKTSKGQLILEGSLSEDYYKIRTIIYAQHALL
ncbi:18060_t:CDS:10 [Entrophospora sp. SA101]|nr:18060_t:CDS:10 [Entrophospora sp. SA101]CAJ0911688.1 2193_t:CDS:10 [Entrophospora sp. SA101]CAJ0911741.1 2221_t:CDS:10 [Entrophospora sp. SA101]